MAIYEPGPLIGRMRGRIGGLVATNSRSSPVLRAWRYPTDPASPTQSTHRARFTIAVARWRDILTDAQRTNWNNLSPTTTLFNSLGMPFHPTGRQLFIRADVFRQASGTGTVDIAPVSAKPFWPNTQITATPPGPVLISAISSTQGFSPTAIAARLSTRFDTTKNTWGGPWTFFSQTVWVIAAAPHILFPALTITLAGRYFLELSIMTVVGGVGYKQFYEINI